MRSIALVLIAAMSRVPAAASEETAESPTLVVSAASDLLRAFPEIGAEFTRKTGIRVVFNFGATRMLAAQIENGAPVDLFAAADVATVERLERLELIVPGTRRTYAFGLLALCTSPRSKDPLKSLADLTSPSVRHVAIANPDHAPYGMAAREALQKAGIWEAVHPKMAFGENVGQAMQYVETSTVDAAVVAYSLAINSKVRWVLVPDRLHRPIEQTLCVIRTTRHEEAALRFAAFIVSEGSKTLRRYGFRLPRTPKRKQG